MVSKIDYRREETYESVTYTRFRISALGGILWSDLGFLPFVCKASGTTIVKGVVKGVISNALIKH
jgi:hypothetical protein